MTRVRLSKARNPALLPWSCLVANSSASRHKCLQQGFSKSERACPFSWKQAHPILVYLLSFPQFMDASSRTTVLFDPTETQQLWAKIAPILLFDIQETPQVCVCPKTVRLWQWIPPDDWINLEQVRCPDIRRHMNTACLRRLRPSQTWASLLPSMDIMQNIHPGNRWKQYCNFIS